ncbi:hypothetical protein BCR41DRAFT_370550 [Lobosporangium transversale]|uniref:Uncharacterized protein n=1 Tax=Lobosporangium transversale TaxID=64571 RepID=A0A1Y2GQ24_9FUNG|nr:hypothetical protein BCR41DRAFT_370550 [Lobosporangium transversale]ORZ16787.1 hypothetical protein BCR41DRAFT_370550 [Lobosporangium transversale]|eukprot:XP_021881722.1 hypothetical protein BCR41DRAFT_370550 [Lobosporangium transversale]
MADHDMNDSDRILASINNGNGATGVLATVVNLPGNGGGRSVKTQHSGMTSDDILSTLTQTTQNQALSRPPPPSSQQQQQPQQPQPQPLHHHHVHHPISVHDQGSSQHLTATAANGVSNGNAVAASSRGIETNSLNGNTSVQVPTGTFGLSLGHLSGISGPASQLLQHQPQTQQQTQQQQQHQFLILQQQQHEEHQRQLKELHDQEQGHIQHHQQQQQTVIQSNIEDAPLQDIIVPNREQEFDSLEAAQQAAERYARSANTVVIVKRTTKDKNGVVVQASSSYCSINGTRFPFFL